LARKELKYASWKFSLSILLGIVAMFIGLQSHFGWQGSNLSVPPLIPIDNPDERHEYPEDTGVRKQTEDLFRSLDGY
jgi:hypothetical protein